MNISLAVIGYYDTVNGVEGTLYVASGNGLVTGPNDSPPNTT